MDSAVQDTPVAPHPTARAAQPGQRFRSLNTDAVYVRLDMGYAPGIRRVFESPNVVVVADTDGWKLTFIDAHIPIELLEETP